MHELSLVRSICDEISALSRKESFRKVSRLRLGVGVMSGVVPECIEFCFSEASKGTPLEGAELVIENVLLRVRCQSCSAQTSPEPFDLRCQNCGSYEVIVLAGKDFVMIDLEVD